MQPHPFLLVLAAGERGFGFGCELTRYGTAFLPTKLFVVVVGVDVSISNQQLSRTGIWEAQRERGEAASHLTHKSMEAVPVWFIGLPRPQLAVVSFMG